MQIQKFTAKNFRCFKDFSLDFKAPAILLLGENGSGKTSIMEALHYLCYLKSFRSSSPKDLIHIDSDNFFIKLDFDDREPVQVGFSQSKRQVKISNKSINSYKELMDHFCVITLTEDDLFLVSGGPEFRRSLIDQQVLLHDPSFIKTYSDYKKILDNRNSLIKSGSFSNENYRLWTDKLIEVGNKIKKSRKQQLLVLNEQVLELTKGYFPELEINFDYYDKIGQFLNSEDLLNQKPDLISQERRFSRSLIGPHLDDFIIKINNQLAKTFASRGQRKLITLLIKAAQANYFGKNKKGLIFLLDDFLTDFDKNKIKVSTQMLNSISCQLVFSCPLENKELIDLLSMGRAQIIKIQSQ